MPPKSKIWKHIACDSLHKYHVDNLHKSHGQDAPILMACISPTQAPSTSVPSNLWAPIKRIIRFCSFCRAYNYRDVDPSVQISILGHISACLGPYPLVVMQLRMQESLLGATLLKKQLSMDGGTFA